MLWLFSFARAASLQVLFYPANLPPMHCTAAGIQAGALLSGPAFQMGEATVEPLIEVVGTVGHQDVYWRTALKVTQPGLISIARTDDRQDPPRASLNHPVTVVFHRDEQTVSLTATFGEMLPAQAPRERPVWDSTSWYRPAAQLKCSPQSLTE